MLGAYGAIGGVAAAVALGVGDADRGPRARLRAGGADLGWLEPAGRQRGDRAAARAPSARPADPDRDRRGGAHRAGVPAHLARLARALVAAGVQPADRAGARRGFHRHGDADADRGRVARARGGGRRAAAAGAHALRARLARLRGRSGHRGAVRRRRAAAVRRDVPARGPARRPRGLDRRGLLRQHLVSRSARCSG